MYQVEFSSKATIVRVRCEIDPYSRAEFEAVLGLAASLDSARLIVSLEECSFLDCAGVAALVKIRGNAKVPMSVVLAKASHLCRLFAILNLEERLHVTYEFPTDAAPATTVELPASRGYADRRARRVMRLRHRNGLQISR